MAKTPKNKYDTLGIMEGFEKSARRAKLLGALAGLAVLGVVVYVIFFHQVTPVQSTSELFAPKAPTESTVVEPPPPPPPPPPVKVEAPPPPEPVKAAPEKPSKKKVKAKKRKKA